MPRFVVGCRRPIKAAIFIPPPPERAIRLCPHISDPNLCRFRIREEPLPRAAVQGFVFGDLGLVLMTMGRSRAADAAFFGKLQARCFFREHGQISDFPTKPGQGDRNDCPETLVRIQVGGRKAVQIDQYAECASAFDLDQRSLQGLFPLGYVVLIHIPADARDYQPVGRLPGCCCYFYW